MQLISILKTTIKEYNLHQLSRHSKLYFKIAIFIITTHLVMQQ